MAGSVAPAGVPTERVAGGQSHDPRSFGATMQTVGNADTERVSGSLLPPDAAVSEPESTLSADAPDLVLSAPPALLQSQLSGEPLNEVPGLEQPIGTSLPENGNSLPPIVTVQTPEPEVSVATLTKPGATASEQLAPLPQQTQLPPAVIETTQAAVASVPAQPLLPNGRLVPDTTTAGSTVTVAEDSSTLPSQTSAESDLQQDLSRTRLLQQALESMAARQDSVLSGRATAIADFATISPDSVPAGFAQSNSPVPVQFDQLMELPQFQNMRPLQPTSDPQTFMAGLGQRLMVMSEEGIQSARLKLHPENLGTLDVRIQIEDDTARVWFTAQHGQAREALESALPKLKDLFAQQGMELIEADVGSGNDERRAADTFDRADDSYPSPIEMEPDFMNEFGVPPNVGYVSAHALDIYV